MSTYDIISEIRLAEGECIVLRSCWATLQMWGF